MRFGRLHFRLVRRRGDLAPFRFDAKDCLRQLAELARSLHGLPWMVVSGLVEPLIKGRFLRAHGDVDIAVPVEQLAPVAAALVGSGYVLTTRVLRSYLNGAWELQVYLRIEPGLLAWRRRRLRLWRTRADGELDEGRFPRYLDVFAYRLDGRELQVLDSGWRFSFSGGIAMSVELPGGPSILVESPAHRRLPMRSPAHKRRTRSNPGDA